MKIFGPLIAATAEILSTDPATQTQGRLWYNTTTPALKFSTGTAAFDVLTDFLGTTKGDILARTATGFQRLAAGADGQVLGALASQTSGLQWVNPSTGLRNYIANGDFEIGAVTGFSLAKSLINITSGYPIPTSVAPAGTAASSATLTTGGSASANLSLNLVNSNQLAGTYSASLVSTAVSSVGDMLLSNAFTIYKEDQARIQTIRFFYSVVAGASGMNFSGTLANTFSIWIYDVTAAQWIQPMGVYSLTQSSGVGYATASFQTNATSTQYQLALINTVVTGGAYTLYVDDIQVGPQPSLQASAVITDWVQYTPTIVGFGTPTSVTVFTRRVGGNLEGRGFFNSGTPTATPNSMTIGFNGSNANVNINTSIVANNGYAGDMTSVSSASTNYRWAAYVGPSGTTTIQFGVQTSTGNSQTASQNGSALGISNTNAVLFSFSVPIQGWQSSSNILNQDNDNRVCAAYYVLNAATAVSANTSINYDTKIFDTHAAVTTGAGVWKFVVPVTGFFEVSTTSDFTVNTNTDIYLTKNGSNVQFMGTCPTTAIVYAGTATVQANAGDTLAINTSAAVTLQGKVSTVPTTAVSIRRVTGPATVTPTESINMLYSDNSGQAVTATTTNYTYNIKNYDSNGSFSGGLYTCSIAGKYLVQVSDISATSGYSLRLYKNGVWACTVGYGAAANKAAIGGATIACNAGDQLSIRSDTTLTRLSVSPNDIFLAITRTGN